MTTAQQDRTGLVGPTRQIVLGIVLVLVGSAVAAALIEGGSNALSGVGFATAAAGLALVANGLVLRHRGGDESTRGGTDDGFDSKALIALVLAVVVPPVGVVMAAWSPVEHRRGRALGALAIAVGTVLTVVYTFLVVLSAVGVRAD